MTDWDTIMTLFRANPFVFLFSIAAIVAVGGFIAYSLYDRVGLELRTANAIVTGKQYNPPGKTYTSEMINGRTYVKTHERPETYVVTLLVGSEQTIGLVSRQTFDALRDGDAVTVQLRRTRRSHRLEAVAVRR